MALGLEHAIPFGKYKGKTVGMILTSDVGYLLWLRDTKEKETGARGFFSPAVLWKLNEAIVADNRNNAKTLRGKYTVWTGLPQAEPETKEEILAAMKLEREAMEESERNASIYEGRWGMF